jgi:two-component system, OmpR family, sensor histidine kinase MtrB
VSIRTLLTVSIVSLLIVAGAAAVCLVVFTAHLDATANSLNAATEGIRIAEQLEVDLLRHNRLTTQPALPGAADAAHERATLARALKEQLAQAVRLAGTPKERDVANRARTAVEHYLGATDEDSADRRLERALDGLSELVAFNVAEAEAAGVEAARWNRVGTAVGGAAAVLLIFGTAVVLGWLHLGAFQPLFRVRDTIERFAAGDRGVRALDAGPAEIRTVARSFNEMARQLAEQRQRQLTFLAAVVHDLRNPLAPLKAAVECAKRADVLENPGQIERFLTIIAKQVDHLERMTSDLLDSARIEAGQLELRLDHCDLRESITMIQELFGATSTLHRLEVRVPQEPVWIRCDELRIQQVLANLVSNAIKYSPDGGTVGISVQATDELASVIVADQGIGIEPDDLRRIFEPFRRSSSVERIPGVGLGLAVTRRLVIAHGGTIDVQSRPAAGTTFTVTLPRAPARQAGRFPKTSEVVH